PRLLVRVGSALVHERVEPSGGGVHGEMLRPADAPRGAPVLVGEERPRLPEAGHVAGNVDGMDDAVERDEEPFLPATDRLLGDRVLLRVEEDRAAVDGARLAVVIDGDPEGGPVGAEHEEAPAAGGVDEAAPR